MGEGPLSSLCLNRTCLGWLTVMGHLAASQAWAHPTPTSTTPQVQIHTHDGGACEGHILVSPSPSLSTQEKQLPVGKAHVGTSWEDAEGPGSRTGSQRVWNGQRDQQGPKETPGWANRIGFLGRDVFPEA